ncbi:DUF1259 domain-containing protein [Bacillus sp. ISL-4]|uniref:DUF1259 domain-containing protein n=1 Tax=Bacillus sp. ISL-4 TaxID=2819125 RepID=UPI001BE81B58|nr:DUF1259 domain-containing protein [Bacillus sp. ISL-4]MBT2667579.1 DUF1259 domain-containing protein [Bacillus sp. ISL-4]MBT2671183.1 DUF1259 domain-containing protein [Streptomyces sp. ISL-14]
MSKDLCKELAKILKGEALQKNNVCMVTRERSDLKPTILGQSTQSEMVISLEFSFEPISKKSETLNLAELVFLQEEVNPFLKAIKMSDHIKVSATHNHWLFEKPRLIYMHLESIQSPLEFAKEVAKALKKAGIK